jgi:FRG domain
MHISVDAAKQAAIELVKNIETGAPRGEPLQIRREAFYTATEALHDIEVFGERQSPGGIPADQLAPSVWHAMCALLRTDLRSRMSKLDFETDEPFDTFFLHRPIYRGQSKPWSLQPTARRVAFPTERAIRAIRDYLQPIIAASGAPELELIGHSMGDLDALALAQHYSVPTALLDFTFDPFVAFGFALDGCTSDDDVKDAPKGCAAVYFTSVYKLVVLDHATVRFPPIYARRLYRQCGAFASFPGSDSTESPSGRDQGLLERNCGRMFFPRDYPTAAERLMFRDDAIVTRDAFFEQVVSAAAEFAASSEALEDAEGFVALRVSEPPPWERDLPFYTDDEFDAMAGVLERYLTRAALVQMNGVAYLDPLVLALIARWDDRILTALRAIAGLPGSGADQREWIAAAIRRSLERAARFYANRAGRGHGSP